MCRHLLGDLGDEARAIVRLNTLLKSGYDVLLIGLYKLYQLSP